jgi:hypothetical protein
VRRRLLLLLMWCWCEVLLWVGRCEDCCREAKDCSRRHDDRRSDFWLPRENHYKSLLYTTLKIN